jgi:putative ABC transport system ATP-binding protein
MIELRSVSKTFNAGKPNVFTALSNITLTLASNEVTLFQGPSGSGKTTLLTIISSMSRPTSGRVFLDGVEITSLTERFLAEIRRERFGFIFQNYNLVRGMTVLENVMVPAYPLGRKFAVIRRKALDLLDSLRVAAKAGQKVEVLSGGEQQRVAIARALINDPPVLVADEPTAHLDTELSKEFILIMRGLKSKGKTIIIASHDPLVAESGIADRIVLLRDGTVLIVEAAA